LSDFGKKANLYKILLHCCPLYTGAALSGLRNSSFFATFASEFNKSCLWLLNVVQEPGNHPDIHSSTTFTLPCAS
jgi:hypothetical protein